MPSDMGSRLLILPTLAPYTQWKGYKSDPKQALLDTSIRGCIANHQSGQTCKRHSCRADLGRA